MAKYEVQKGRTVTTRMGVAHEGGKIEPENFTGDNAEAKQAIVDKLVSMGCLKEVPLTEAEQVAILKAQEIQDGLKAEREAESERLKAETEAEEKKKEAAKAEREATILEADFDEMNKQPMIDFASDNDIELTGTKADEIREELKAYQESLTAPE